MNRNQKAHITLREQAVIYDIDPNRAACRAENADQMRRRAERDAEARALTFGYARPEILLLNGEWV